jgi:hypothetical protein
VPGVCGVVIPGGLEPVLDMVMVKEEDGLPVQLTPVRLRMAPAPRSTAPARSMNSRRVKLACFFMVIVMYGA